MKQTLPISFYLKLSFIFLVFSWTYFTHRPIIDASLADTSLSTSETLNTILKEILGFHGSTDGEVGLISTHEIVSQPGNRTPQQLSQEIHSLPNYQHAAERAAEFNLLFDPDNLNMAFNQLLSQQRENAGSAPMEIGTHLAAGTTLRAQELSHYHYLGSNTVDGNTFYSLFPEMEDAQYRLGENLYELYIAADDIHLETWQNSSILAEYLYEVFQDSMSSEAYQHYQSYYLMVQAEPSDYNIDSAAYVRLVVVLMLDINSPPESLAADI